jgi:hypothetical protein
MYTIIWTLAFHVLSGFGVASGNTCYKFRPSHPPRPENRKEYKLQSSSLRSFPILVSLPLWGLYAAMCTQPHCTWALRISWEYCLLGCGVVKFGRILTAFPRNELPQAIVTKSKLSKRQVTLFPTCLFGSIFNPEDGGHMLFRNIGTLLPDQATTRRKTQNVPTSIYVNHDRILIQNSR